MLWDHTKEKLTGKSNFLSEMGAEKPSYSILENTTAFSGCRGFQDLIMQKLSFVG